MAVSRRMEVVFGSVFPNGAYLVGDVEPVGDFNQDARPDGTRPQQTDPETGELVWTVPVLDADPEARKNEKTINVKISARQQPVPPANPGDLPFVPVEFEGLTLTPWIDDNGVRPKLAWSFRAKSMTAPGKPSKSSGAGRAESAAA
ncbi:plasmid replication, integration and excision activator [Janibacter terrae]|uniref:plasmid replication, integration and excision activator n=1 Tax=Janibacter terrae TaxID=103817 RepID=UPI0031F941BA